MSLKAGEMLRHYRLLEPIGEGGMGVVWRALDTTLDRLVALKVLAEPLARDPRVLERFESEARAVAALAHPNIVTLHSVEQHGDVRFLTMELIPGRPLSQEIPPGGVPLPKLLEIAVALFDAVAAAHERGIVHLDLKPANVMITEPARVKVLDFGLARRERVELLEAVRAESGPAPEASHLTGTLPYMSPEQLVGGAVDHRSDLFSLGVILHEMCTGRRPFEGGTWSEIASAILNHEPPLASDLNPGIPRSLARLVRHCLEKQPDRRPADARRLRDELEVLRREREGQRGALAPSVAVLPLADRSPARDQGHLGEGIAEAVIHLLTRVEGLHVASRATSFRFRGSTLDRRAIGLDLGVGALLDGRIARDGERLEVAAELIGTADGFCLWSARWNVTMSDVFAVEEDLARRVAESLAGGAAASAPRRTATANPEAYDLYLRGRQFFLRYGKRPTGFALDLFRRAIERDPEYAPAWTGVADCHSYLYLYVDRNDEHRRAADEASRRALELDPRLAQAHASRALALSLLGRHDEARPEFEAAIGLDPRLFEAVYFYARDCFAQGEARRAARLYEWAMAIRPEDYQSPLLVAQIYEDLGRLTDAESVRRRGLAVAERHLEAHPDDVRAIYMAANAMAAIGETALGLAWAARALELDPDDSMTLYNVACVFAMAGCRDRALATLESALRAGLIHREWVEGDSNLASLRGDPRFERLLASMNAR